MKLNKRTLDGLCDFFLNRLENFESEAEMVSVLSDILQKYDGDYAAPHPVKAWNDLPKLNAEMFLRLMCPEMGDKTLRNWLNATVINWQRI